MVREVKLIVKQEGSFARRSWTLQIRDFHGWDKHTKYTLVKELTEEEAVYFVAHGLANDYNGHVANVVKEYAKNLREKWKEDGTFSKRRRVPAAGPSGS